MTGIVLEGGYLAARRTLLHCSDLMEGMGRWKSRTFSQILHIMSDDLTDYEGHSNDEEEVAGYEMDLRDNDDRERTRSATRLGPRDEGQQQQEASHQL